MNGWPIGKAGIAIESRTGLREMAKVVGWNSMARKVFYSFHYTPDNWRAAQVRQMGVIEGDAPCSDNDWEKVTKGGDDAIKKWIAGQMSGKSCVVVLIGNDTAGRKWINHARAQRLVRKTDEIRIGETISQDGQIGTLR